MLKKILFVVLALSLLCSCANKAQTGAAHGAAAGALIGQAIGQNTEATLIGIAAGALLGYLVGNEMEREDKALMNRTYETGRSYESREWVNPDTGNQYSVTPRPAYRNPRGRDCREAEILTIINGKAEKTIATACRENGRWVIQ
ncbi:MAG: glycine zipper domain-containing protein [Thermodesulfobacteriota bacterium]|nr:glycine zipper domain-containing protein [Thermodesulfobacteriota bacterium]